MKYVRTLCMALACAAVLCTAGISAHAQALDGQWFKLKISVKGYSVGPGEVVGKARLKTTAYLYMAWNSGMGRYDYTIVCETGPGFWIPYDGGVIYRNFCSEEYIFVADEGWDIAAPDGAVVHFNFTGMIKSTLAAPGALRRAVFSTLGAEVYDGTTAVGDDIYGGATVKGTTVDVGKLPFTP